MNKILFVFLIFVVLLTGCRTKTQKESMSLLIADYNNGGITLPEGFHALIVIDNIGRGQHLVINSNGDIYMALKQLENGKGIVGLRDNNGDGKADLIRYFGNMEGTGIDIYNGYLYFGSDSVIVRYQLKSGELIPDTIPEIVADGFPVQDTHKSKAITIDLLGNLYVSIGAPSNACIENTGQFSSKGLDPCPQLERQAGIWKFSANKLHQDQVLDGLKFASGIRNSLALNWNNITNKLYAVQQGRDQLSQLFPSLFSENDGINLPAEEFLLIEEGDDFGWPYCYYDPFQVKKVLAPEYGGTGTIIGRCEFAKDPIMTFPAHIAPNSLVFYNKEMFPEKYRKGAFVTFHGPWNKAPVDQEGYFVAYIPFNGIYPVGQWEIFANNFAGSETINNPREAQYRPTGLAVGPDGSLYISDSRRGKIWRIFYN